MNSIYNNAYAKARLIVKQKIMEAKDLAEDSELLEDLVAKKSDLINEVAEKIVDKTKEKVNDKFTAKFGERKVRKNSVPIEIHSKFDEEVSSDTPAYRALVKKAESNDIPVEIIGEVYDRGWRTWNEEVHNVSQQQYAFARVNSYINQGKTYFNEDADLHTYQDMLSEDKYEGKYLHTTYAHKGDHGSGYVTGYDTKKKGNVILTVNIGQGVRSKNDNPTKDISVHPDHLTPDWKKSYMVKEEVDLTEGTMQPYVKPHIEKGSTKQSAWKAANKYGKVRYFGMDFKKAAEKHAGLNEETLEEAKMKEVIDDIDQLDHETFVRKYGKPKHKIKSELKWLKEPPIKEEVEQIDEGQQKAAVRAVSSITHKTGHEAAKDVLLHHGFKQGTYGQWSKGNKRVSKHIDPNNGKSFYSYKKFSGKIPEEDTLYAADGDATGIGHAISLHKKLSEEVGQIDELSKDTLASYKSKASKEAKDLNDTASAHNFLANKHSGTKLSDVHKKKSLVAWTKAKKRERGLSAADRAENREIGTDSLAKIYKESTPGQSVEESVTAAEKVPVVVPAHKDQYGNTIPAKTVMRKSQRHIMSTGNVYDGKGE